MISKKTTFLVVDDFEPMRKITSAQLRAMGASSIVTANNGAEAMRMLLNRRVDIILSDWNMPVMSGLELLQAVRANKLLSRLPFIMITAEVERERVKEAIASGVSELLVKPYTSERLALRVEKVLATQSRSSLPARAAPAEKRDISAVSVKSAHKFARESVRQTILVVDDTPDNLHLLSHLFKDEYRVRIAHSGEKALDICQSNDPPDLVLLDIMMPGMDGFEVAKRMREHPTSAAIPVIFVTAMTSDDARLKGLELGAVDFVTKPIDPNVLKPRVRNFMRYVQLHKQLQSDYDNMLEAARLHEDVEHITRHDMKGPLAGVIGLVQALANDTSMGHTQVGQLRMAEESALQLLDMINLSSELFKIESGRFKLQAKPVMIGDILRRSVAISHATFAEKHLDITLDTDGSANTKIPKALGEAMFCYSLFQNLIKNACEAAPEKSQITVTLTDGSPLRIKISNKGVVPAQIRDQFFEKFVTYGKQGGSGLGTYSAKMLAEAQNGTIALEVSDAEEQTTITVTLPRYAESLL